MVQLKNARVTPSGVVPGRGLRLMDSPFSESGTAMQNVQPWVDNPNNLSDDQLQVVGWLINAAKANEGTTGTVINPKTGRPMPRIAKKVKEHFESNDRTVSEEEQKERAKEKKKEHLKEKRDTPRYAAFKSRLAEVNASAAGELIMKE